MMENRRGRPRMSPGSPTWAHGDEVTSYFLWIRKHGERARWGEDDV